MTRPRTLPAFASDNSRIVSMAYVDSSVSAVRLMDITLDRATGR
jgi:hypothetical protein